MPLHPDAEAFLQKRNEFRTALQAALAPTGDAEDEEETGDETGDQTDDIIGGAGGGGGSSVDPNENNDEEEEEEDGEEEGEEEEEEDDNPNDIMNEGGTEDDCDVPGRDEDADGDDGDDEGEAGDGETIDGDEDEEDNCSEIQDRLAEVPKIESFSDPSGWPNSDNLYADLHKELKDQVAKLRAGQLPLTDMRLIIEYQRQLNVMESYRKMLLHKKQRWCHFVSSWCECMKDETRSQEELAALMQNQAVGAEVQEQSA